MKPYSSDNLIVRLGLQNLSYEEKIRIIEAASDLVWERTKLRLLEEAGADGRARLKDALESGASDEEFFDAAIDVMPTVTTILEEEMERVANEMEQRSQNG